MKKIIIDSLSKCFDHPVLTDFDMEAEMGGVYALMGPSGCGKTTLLRILAGLEQADSGLITGTDDLRVSFMFQEDRLLPWLSAVDNLRFVLPSLPEDAVIEKLDQLGIGGQDARRPVSEYSGGMKRRVAFLRTVLFPSDLLLLDEPFTGLDEANIGAAAAFLTDNRNGRTVILTTHSEQEAGLCRAEVIRM
ncbi:MAG: ABC transporter ATP-binding protein [Lachnospiraceae bacterium]|nr:ABC transporter ATP-binding protein [Lachnospiraceae bacterium]